ncbi:MAG: methionine aminotransferase [Steroidobacteraceae bacterium]
MTGASKLPDVGTTIFTVISRRASELGAINVGQGFPDYPIDPQLADCVAAAMRAGHNQYAPMEGAIELREAIALQLARNSQVVMDPVAEITVTVGATEAIYCAIQAMVGAGDEAIVFDPSYDSYDPAVRLAGGRCVHVPLVPPAFRYDWDRVRAALSPRTRLIVFNSPANPACTVASAADLQALADIAERHDLTVLSDEVYEHVVFDGRRHYSVLATPSLAARSFAVYSFGKTLHATGVRVGYCVAPAGLTRELRKVHQYNTFSVAAPLQHGIASYLASRPTIWDALAPEFERKRNLLLQALQGSRFVLRPAEGAYFQLLDFSDLARHGDVAFTERLLVEAGVATIPLSPFYQSPPPLTLIRLCIAKRDATLLAAAERLQAFAAGRPRPREASDRTAGRAS